MGAEVLVVGGGIVGTACAYHLARRGVRVTLLERAEIAAGASGRNHGLLFVPADAACRPLYDLTLSTYRALAAETPLHLRLSERPAGILIVGADQASLEAARQEADPAAEAGLHVEEVGPEAIRELEPGLARDLVGGFLLEDGFALDPAATTLAHAFAALEAGADVRTHAPVRALLARGGKVRGVVTDGGLLEADAVVLAAGPWSAGLALGAGLDLSVRGARGWLLLTAPFPEGPRRLIFEGGWHIAPGDPGPPPATVASLAEGAPPPSDFGCVLQPTPGGHVVVGGSRRYSIHEEPEAPETVAAIARRAARLLPALGGLPVLAAWSGVRPTSADGRPYLGWAPGTEGLFLAVGHGGQGMMLGGGTGVLVADLLTGARPSLDPAPLDPAGRA